MERNILPHHSSQHTFTNYLYPPQDYNSKIIAAKLHRTEYAPNPTLNNRRTDILPEPLPNLRAEMSIRRATPLFAATDISAAISKELAKHFETYNSLTPISKSNIEPKSVILRSQMFIKKKSNGILSTRLAIDGSTQPQATYNDTYAGTSDTTNRAFILSAYIADAAHRGCLPDLQFGDFDFPGAFLHNKLTRQMTNGYQLLAALPKDIPGPLAGQLAEITGCCYGSSKQTTSTTRTSRYFLQMPVSSIPPQITTPSSNVAPLILSTLLLSTSM